jgi:hypothetical protein
LKKKDEEQQAEINIEIGSLKVEVNRLKTLTTMKGIKEDNKVRYELLKSPTGHRKEDVPVASSKHSVDPVDSNFDFINTI